MYIIKSFIAGLALILLCQVVVCQQLKLGNNPYTVQKSAILDLESNNQGLLLVRISDTTSINTLTPPDGMVIYFTPTKQLMVRSSGYWQPLSFTFTRGNLTEATSSVLTITGGSNAILGSGASIQVKQASGSQSGFLSGTDWTTFNNKQAALSGSGFVKISGTTISYDNSTYLTGNQAITLSGDVTGSGATAITTTLANSGVTAGTYNGPYTVNAKGLVTAASSVTFNTPSRSLSTTGSNNTFTISTKAARVYYTINFSVAILLSSSNGQVDLDYSLDAGSNWVNVSSVSQVFSGSVSTNQNMVLSGEIPPNALVRINRSQNSNVTITLTSRQQEVY